MIDTPAAASLIASARRHRRPLQSLAAEAAPRDESEGYRIQGAVHDLLAADFGALAGYKIGCTSAGVSLPAHDFVRVGVECEIAVRLARGLAPGQAPFTAAAVADAVEAYLPAIEIVDDRYADWQSIGAPTLVADDFFAAGCVLGNPVARPLAPDLLDVVGHAVINGIEAGRGTGADVLGHPLHALAWLANQLATSGKGLRAGQIVLTGSLVKTVWLKPGDRVTMDLSGLGAVEVAFD